MVYMLFGYCQMLQHCNYSKCVRAINSSASITRYTQVPAKSQHRTNWSWHVSAGTTIGSRCWDAGTKSRTSNFVNFELACILFLHSIFYTCSISRLWCTKSKNIKWLNEPTWSVITANSWVFYKRNSKGSWATEWRMWIHRSNWVLGEFIMYIYAYYRKKGIHCHFLLCSPWTFNKRVIRLSIRYSVFSSTSVYSSSAVLIFPWILVFNTLDRY